MNFNTRSLAIYDTFSFTTYLVNRTGTELNETYGIVANTMVDYFVEWVINEVLLDQFGISVVNHYSHDLFKNIYRTYQLEICKNFAVTIDQDKMRLLRGQQVRTLVNGRDLFISQRITYD